MGKTEEQFAKLEGFIEELAIQADISKAVREKSEKFMAAISGIQLDTTENFAMYRRFVQESFSSDLEYYRDKIAIIRTISPETANHLEQKLNKYEKMCLKMIRDVDRIEKIAVKPSPEKTDLAIKDLQDIKQNIKDLWVDGKKIEELIELNHNFLQDILKFLRAE